MTHEPKHDEQILDYLYGELSDAERAAFEHRLSEDQELRAEVDALGGVRAAYKKLPPAEQSADSAQRMTALLMQQAAQLHGGGGTPDRKPDEEEIGKVLPFGTRWRGLRRVLLHPASGVFAAAAVALCWVVFKENRQPNFEVAVSDTPLPQAGSPASGPALMPAAPPPAAPAPTTPPSEPTPTEGAAKAEQQAGLATKPADRLAELEGAARDRKTDAPAAKGSLRKEVAPALDDSLDSDFASGAGGKKKVSTYAAADKRAEAPAPATAKTRSAGDDLDSSFGAAGGGAARGPIPAPPKPEPVAREMPAQALASKKAPVRTDTLNFGGLEQKPASPSSTGNLQRPTFAQLEVPTQTAPPASVSAPPPVAAPSGRASASPPPPPAPAPEGVSGIVAQTQARRSERVVEELANQELAGTGSMPPQAAPTQVGSNSNEPYSARVQKNTADGESARSSRTRSVDEYTQNPAPGASAQMQAQLQNTDNAPRRAYSQNGADDDAGATQLAQLVQHIKGGRCPDAYTLLRQLEQGSPTTRGLGEARSLYLRTCTPGQNQTQPQNTNTSTNPPPALQLDQNRGERQMMLEAPAPPPAYAPAPSAYSERNRISRPMPAKRAAKPVKSKADAAY